VVFINENQIQKVARLTKDLIEALYILPIEYLDIEKVKNTSINNNKLFFYKHQK
jgi:hypothetical protein